MYYIYLSLCVLIVVFMVYIMMSDDGLDVDWILDRLDYMDWIYICICGYEIDSDRAHEIFVQF